MPTDEAKLIVRFEAENKKLHRQLEQTQKRMKRFERSAKKSTQAVSGSFRRLAAGVSLGLLAKKIIDVTKAQEAAVKQLEQGLASTGNVVGKSLEELTAKAAELQRASTFGDEEIISAMSQLVTFTSIAGDQFDRTTQSVLDLSTRMGQDLRSSVVQLGKALNDPVSNLGALGRAGIQFSDEQKALIKSLAETNRLSDAQNLILDELETQFGGSAQAARDTLGGALAALNNAFGDLLEADSAPGVTRELNELTDLLQDPQTVAAAQTLTSALIKSFSAVTQAIAGTVKAMQSLGEGIARLTQGPAADSLEDLTAKVENLQKQRAEIIRVTGSGIGDWVDPRVEQLDNEISKLQSVIALRRELIANKSRTTPSPSAPGATTSTVTTPAVDNKALKKLNDSAKRIIDSLKTDAEEYREKVRIITSSTVDGKAEALRRLEREFIGKLELAQLDKIKIDTGSRENQLQEFESRFSNLRREIDLYGEVSEAAKLRYDIEEGLIEGLSNAQADILVEMQGRIDTLNSEAELIAEIEAEVKRKSEEMSAYADQMARNIQDAFADFLFDPFSEGLDGMLKGFLDLIRRMIAEALAADIIGAITGKGGGNVDALIGGVGELFGGFFADGGRPDPNKISIVGERGPEMFIPDGVSGRVVPGEMAAPNIKNINVFDPSIVGDYLSTDPGQRVIVNVIQRNRSALGI